MKNYINVSLLLCFCVASLSQAFGRTHGKSNIIFRLKSELRSSSASQSRRILKGEGKDLTDLLSIANIHPILESAPKPPLKGSFSASATARRLEDDEKELEALKRHNLHLYYTIRTEEFGHRTSEEIMKLLSENPMVEYVEEEPIIVPAQFFVDGDPVWDTEVEKSDAEKDLSQCEGVVNCQWYLHNTTKGRLNGVNALEAHRLARNTGENALILQIEISEPDWLHVDLPSPWIVVTNGTTGYHATASAGIMWGKDNGRGVKGIAAGAKAGYMKYGFKELVDLRHYLKAGDVIQFGVQFDRGNVKDVLCKGMNVVQCVLPVEDFPPVRNAIEYLIKEKGVHVILAAGNGNIDLDHSNYRGRFSRSLDTGAIYVGAAEPLSGKRAVYSNYGSRVDLFSWGQLVTTTTYEEGKHDLFTHSFGGTSSANPIIAACAAFVQSVARAKGIGNLPPKTLRQLLYDSGTEIPTSDGKRIGRQPDLVNALRLLDSMTTTESTNIGNKKCWCY